MVEKPRRLSIEPVGELGEIEAGADLGDLLARLLLEHHPRAAPRAVVIVAQKVVSKAEGRLAHLDEVVPSARALELAAVTGKDAALVELILRESTDIVRAQPNVLIVRHRLGYVMANAGIDQSNVRSRDGRPVCLLLPLDPSRSAQRIREALRAWQDPAPAVIISDSFGRPWRRGVVNVALGSAGLPALIDCRGQPDRYGRVLKVTEVAFADALAAAAGLIMGEADEGVPAALVRGAGWSGAALDARALIRPWAEDLFH